MFIKDSRDYGTRITNLEREIKSKSFEVKDLKEKLTFYQNQNNSGNNASEIENVKRDKNIAVGLVNTMQKDLANKVDKIKQ